MPFPRAFYGILGYALNKADIEQMIISTIVQNGWKYIPAERLPRSCSDVCVEQMAKSVLSDSIPRSPPGRCAILFPLEVLFRNEESSLREKLISLDLVECVIGLGEKLFYNSSMVLYKFKFLKFRC
jgi:hypothetical protein